MKTVLSTLRHLCQMMQIVVQNLSNRILLSFRRHPFMRLPAFLRKNYLKGVAGFIYDMILSQKR